MTAFLDTNVLVYAVTLDPKKKEADRILRIGGVISVQVLNEFANVAHNKLRHQWDRIGYALNQFKLALQPILPLTLETHAAALCLARDNRLSFYGALIVASAIEAGCDTLYSEDMQHGRTVGGLTIRNPFIDSAR